MKSTRTSTKSRLSKETILTWYMNDTLEGNDPKNVYLFSRRHQIKESDFYKFFNSFEGIENHFFELIFSKTLDTLSKSASYKAYSSKEQLLSCYFTFFGNLAANRSFVLYILSGNKLDHFRKLKNLHKGFGEYIDTLDIDTIDFKHDKVNKIQRKAINEAAWFQLVSILKFWLQDESADFEKTDIFIEKSVIAGFDLINAQPLKSVTDLGKFLYKEYNPVG
ncbi:MAG: TetR/AcrR family transcriptional regulator [Chitinophagaceae bacterium]|nr:TetR/AcrR family transcriptional regulator [Chitinophagaceae bacterium]MCZ2395704.1 hypothetical protein [Chitinophagales bacterium]